MSADWDIQLIDTVKAKMCSGCTYAITCHPPQSESSMEFINWEQFCECADKNIKRVYIPSKTPELWT